MAYRSSTELVQFKLTYYQVGDTLMRAENEEFFDEPLFVGLDKDENILDILEKQERDPNDRSYIGWEKFRITKPFIHFSPRSYISDSADYVGVEEDVNGIGMTDVFSEFLQEIATLAEKFGYSYGIREVGRCEGQKTLAIITVWKYNSWGGSSYYGEDEYDSECYLVGAINLFDIEKILLKSTDEPKKIDAKEILELG